MPRDEGFVFAASGERYTTLARRAARTLMGVMPDVQIDLFTDQSLTDPIFAEIHPLDRRTLRPKMEALRRSRFHKTIYLDCDVLAVADVSDIFAMLDRFDLVAAHENHRNGKVALYTVPGTPPNAFPQINSGVMGIRKSPETAAFLTKWEDGVLAQSFKFDQPLLRKLLWEADLRHHILPMDYNLLHLDFLRVMGPRMTAPRLLHLPRLHSRNVHPGDPETPFDLAETIGEELALRLLQLIETDRSLGSEVEIEDVWGAEGTRLQQLRYKIVPHTWRMWAKRKLGHFLTR